MCLTAYSSVPFTHCTDVEMPRIFLVPTEPSRLRKPSKVKPSSGGSGAGTAVEISSLSSGGASGMRMRASSTHSPAWIGDKRVADHLAIADDRRALADIDQRRLVPLRHEGAQFEAAGKARARRQAEIVDDDRDIVACVELDVAGLFRVTTSLLPIVAAPLDLYARASS